MKLALVPLKAELKALVAVLPGVSKNEHGYLYKDMQFVVGSLGKVSFAVSTMKYANLFQPEEVFAFGSCGALTEGVKPLDLVAVSKVVEHDFKSTFLNQPELSCESVLFENLRRVTCASGDQDVLSRELKDRIFGETGADVVTWESAGFFKACRALGVPFTEVRVVTDLANEAGAADFKENLVEGMGLLGNFLKSTLSCET